MTSADSGHAGGEDIVVKHLEGGHSKDSQRTILAYWIDNRWIDWCAGAALGVLIRTVFVPIIHLGSLDPAIRFSVYAATAAGVLAVVAVAFTPLAILTALAPGRYLDHLRIHDRELRANYLKGTLVLLLCALVLIGCGSADASHVANSAAEWVGSLTLGIAAMKTLRLVTLFAAILGANALDGNRERRPRRTRHRAAA